MTGIDETGSLSLAVGDDGGDSVQVDDGVVLIGPPNHERPPKVLPVLPLDDFVLFPGMVAPIIVHTERSAKLMDDVMAGSRFFLGALIRDRGVGDDTVGWEGLHSAVCLGRALKLLKFPDDTLRVLIQGVQRATLTEDVAGEGYVRSHFVTVTEVADSSVELTALARNASARFQDIIGLSPALPDELKVAVVNTEGPGRLADLIAANLNVSLDVRQVLLAEADVKARLNRLMPVLNRELEVLRTGLEIQNQVNETFSKNQREYFLREQLKAIQKELGEQDHQASDAGELEEKLAKANLPDEVAKVADKERKRLATIPSASPEYSVIRTYLELLSELPWASVTEDHFDIGRAKAVLDEDHYDLAPIKDRILEYLSVLKLKQDMKGPILCFIGPPGVGKTSLGQSIARALGRRFIRMSLGGMRDEAEIRGHRRTYIGSMPGRIIQSLRKAGTRNPVFMLDEIDKLGMDFRGDPASALLEVLDPEQNNSFTDHYLDVPFDLSSVLFIATGNMLDTMPGPLRDRMEVIELPGYTHEEKLHIATRHLVGKQLKGHGLSRRKLTITKAALSAIISGYTREAGVRNLDREIAHVCRKAARLFAEGRTARYKVTPDMVPDLLGPEKVEPEMAEQAAGPGVVTGLAWTPTGGDILFVEATRMPGKGTLILTGSLGEVMKESARAALSYLQANAGALSLDAGNLASSDLHIHVPAGAIPKDGPSAGLAMLAAVYSLLTGKPVAPTIAMTGEITLRGKIMPVGGVKEKVLAAARAGITRVVLPEGNRKHLVDIPPEIRRSMTFTCVARADEALTYLTRVSRRLAKERAS